MKYVKQLGFFLALLGILVFPMLETNGAATKITQPVLLSATSINSKSNLIQWEPQSDVDGYLIYRKSNSSSWAKIAEVEGSSIDSYEDKASSKRPLKLGTTYFYSVAAYQTVTNTDGTTSQLRSSFHKTGLKVTTLPEMVDITTLKITTPSLSSMKLSWKATSDATGYGIYRKTPSGTWHFLKNVVGKTTYTDSTIKKGSAYYYSIRAYRIQDGKKYRSNYDRTGVYSIPSLSEPVLVSIASAAYNQVTLSWESVTNATGYGIYRKEKDGTFRKIASVKGTTTTDYQDTTAVAGTLYTYSVRAFNDSGQKTIWSTYNKTGLSIATRPSRVSLKEITSDSYHSATITWELSKNATGYEILRKDANTSFSVIATVENGKTTTYTDTTIDAGITYTYTVRAIATVNGNTTKSYYNKEGFSITPKLTEPLLPTVAPLNYYTIQVTIAPVDGASGYDLYRRSEHSNWRKIKSLTSDFTTFEDKNCATGRTYYYSIRAYRLVNEKKVWSTYNKTGASAFTKPEQPVLSSVSSYNYTTLKITWEPSKKAQGYYIYRKEEGGTFTKIATVTDPESTVYKDSSVTPGVLYYYTVGSYLTIDAKTIDSSFDDKGLFATAVPSTPVLLGAKYNDSTTATVSWKSVAGADGYRVWRKVLGGSYSYISTIQDGSITSFDDTNAIPGTTYYYSVSAFHTENEVPIWGLKNASGRWIRGCKGMDVSKWQGYINWKKASYSNEFAVVRAAYGTSIDTRFTEYMTLASEIDMKLGVYVYSTATNIERVIAEAKNVLEMVKDYPLALPIFCDFEVASRNKPSLREENTAFIRAFCDTIEAAGYEAGVYSGANYYKNAINYQELTDLNIWVANYHKNNSDFTTSYHTWSNGNSSYDFGSIHMWQYTSKGKVDGISGSVDLNIWYTCQ